MDIYDRAKQDIKTITSDTGGAGRSMTFTSPDGVTATVTGIHTKHHMSIDTMGNQVNAKNAHVSVSEELLTALSYPVRIDGKVNMRNHRVAVKDSTGTTRTYIIKEWHQDETVGLIVCILGDYVS